MEQINLTQWLVIILGLIGILKFIADLIMKVKNPNIEQDKEIIAIQKDMAELKKTDAKVELIMTNHLPHINQELVKINTILEERLPRK